MSIGKKQVRLGEIETQLYIYDEKGEITGTRIDVSKIEEILKSKKAVKEYAFIVHDKDTKDDGTLKRPHVHIMMRFNNPTPIKTVCNWFGVTENYFETIGDKNGSSWETAVNYLIHGNDETKFQYAHEEVTSNFNYTAFIDKYKSSINNRKNGNAREKREKEIYDLILFGFLKKHNIASEDQTLIEPFELYKYKRCIEMAFEVRSDRLLEREQTRGEEMEVIYLHGDAGTGKTTHAKKIAEKKGYAISISSSSNDPLQDYKGQECIILDDFRSSGQKGADILKMLDPHTSTSVKSRFKNKSLAECKMIIITSTKTVEEWWSELDFNEKEPIEQFKRRISHIYNIKKNTIDVFVRNNDGFEKCGTIENKIAEIHKMDDLKIQKRREEALKLVAW